jgi:hypothetical protein
MTIYIIFKTNVWHHRTSRELIGVATTKELMTELCTEQATAENEVIDNDQLYNLQNILQTQGYSGDGEFFVIQSETDTLI